MKQSFISERTSTNSKTQEEPVTPHLMVWKERFEQLENLVISRLSRERSLAISENVLRLLTRLFEQLDEHLRSQ